MPRFADFRHPVALGLLFFSVAFAVSIAIWAPWSGRAGWVLVWGALAYAAAVLAVHPGRVQADTALEPHARQPLPSTSDVPPEDILRLTEEALRRLNNPALLASSGLIARLPLTVAEALGLGTADSAVSPLEQARGLRLILETSIERLKPDPRVDASGDSGLLQYSILYEEYVRGRPNNQIMARLSIGEGTFHRHRRQGIRALAGDLATREHHATQREAVG